ncbi:MAG: hypothetical protein JJD92_14220 [Frankiaceae bacterium]|nr:hypothetical protein [Frankiaceae bacterium]
MPRRLLPALPWAAVQYCLIVFVAVRLAMFVIALMTYSLIDLHQAIGVPGWPAPPVTPGWHNAITGWEHSDTLWFLRIGSSGYRDDDQSAAFFPLYPTAIHVVGVALGGHWLLAAFLVSNGALLAGMVLLYRLTESEYGAARARRSVLYLCLFPTALFLFAPYSEPVFLLLAVGSVLCARRRRWLLAGALGAGAALTRSIGVVLVLVLATEALHQLLADRAAERWRPLGSLRALASSLLPAAGTAGYLLWWEYQIGDWKRPISQQSAWGRDFSWPWDTVRQGTSAGLRGVGHVGGGYMTIDLLLMAVAVAACVWVSVRCRPLYAVYAWASLLFPLFSMWDGRPFMSNPRFLVTAFPLFWAIAALGDRWRAHQALVALSAGGLTLLSVLAVASYPIF